MVSIFFMLASAGIKIFSFFMPVQQSQAKKLQFFFTFFVANNKKVHMLPSTHTEKWKLKVDKITHLIKCWNLETEFQ